MHVGGNRCGVCVFCPALVSICCFCQLASVSPNACCAFHLHSLIWIALSFAEPILSFRNSLFFVAILPLSPLCLSGCIFVFFFFSILTFWYFYFLFEGWRAVADMIIKSLSGFHLHQTTQPCKEIWLHPKTKWSYDYKKPPLDFTCIWRLNHANTTPP